MSKSESEARGRQHTLEKLLLELGLGDLDLDGLVDLLLVSALVVGIVLDGGGEKGVDEGRLSQAGLASDLLSELSVGVRTRHASYHGGGVWQPGRSESYHNREASTTLGNDLVSLIRQVGNANGRSAFGGRRSHLGRSDGGRSGLTVRGAGAEDAAEEQTSEAAAESIDAEEAVPTMDDIGRGGVDDGIPHEGGVAA